MIHRKQIVTSDALCQCIQIEASPLGSSRFELAHCDLMDSSSSDRCPTADHCEVLALLASENFFISAER